MHGSSEIVNNVVPAFLTKLWKLVENPEYDDLICWNSNGTSFHVFDQARFSREILPQYFKHSNMASFIRQLNMYGFRKVVNIEQGGLKLGKDDMEFQHPYFVRGQELLLDFIKRKVASGKEEEVKVKPEDVSKVLHDVKQLHGKQESMDSNFAKIKKENEALWREMASLRQKYQKQQKIVNQLIQFLVSLVQPRTTTLPVKRKHPLMINDASHSATDPKTRRLSRQFSLESSSHDNDIALPLSDTGFVRPDFEHNGPIIHDITDNRELLEIEPDDMPSLSLPEEILEVVVNEEPETTNEMEPLAILKKNQSTNDIDKSISSFLGNNLENNENEASSSSTDMSVAISDSKLMNKDLTILRPVSEVNEQLEGMQKDLDSLKDLFAGTNYHFDQNLLHGLINLDGGLPNISDLFESESRGPSNEIIGNELIQYNPPDETISLSGFAEYDESPLFDPLPIINNEEDEEDINSSTRNVSSKGYENMSNNRRKSKDTIHVAQ